MKIAFFDSGMGGLTVLKTAIKRIPDHHYVYFADCKNAPYGNKSKEEIKQITFQAVEFLTTLNIDILVIACNTATSAAVTDLRKKYSFPIIGMEPAIKPAVEKKNNKRILVFATELTLKEEKFKKLVERVDKENSVDYLPLQELVGMAEKFEFEDQKVIDYLQKKLSEVNLSSYETVVLGCTHFPYFKKHFRQLLPKHIKIIDGNEGTINRLMQFVTSENETQQLEYYISTVKSNSETFEKYLTYTES